MTDSNYVDLGVLGARMAEGPGMSMSVAGSGADAEAFAKDLPIANVPPMPDQFSKAAPGPADLVTNPDHVLNNSMKIGQ